MFPIIKKMSNLLIKEWKMKFNKLSNDLNIKLIKGTKRSILCMKDHINNGKNLREKPVDLSLKSKEIAFCPELPLGILSFSSYVDIEVMMINRMKEEDMSECTRLIYSKTVKSLAKIKK